MRLIDEEEVAAQKIRTQKMKRIIIISIILLLILCSAIIVLIAYRVAHPTQITTYIDGVKLNNFDQILDFSTDENGKTQIYIPIRDFATCLNNVNPEFKYQTFKGDYNPKSEDDSKCYVLREGYEVAMFAQKTKIIYKVNLASKSEEYEECTIDKDVFENNGKLYTSVNGIEKGYNVSFSYDENKKIIRIYTLDYLTKVHKTALENKQIENYGTLTISDTYSNCKSIFDGLLIVKTSNEKCGIISTDDYSKFILEPQYDDINFINDSSTFLVESGKKVGLFTKDGKRKIDLVYDKITSMGQNSKLYAVEVNGMQGVVGENGNIVIYPEYNKIGIDVSNFSYNGVKNGYILLDKVIPVQQNDMWALFDKEGKRLSDSFKYKNIGCASVKSGNNIYPLLQISDYKVLVVSDEDDKYAFVDVNGNDSILNFLFDQIYIRVSDGKENYYMIFRDKEYEVLKYLKQTQDSNEKENTVITEKNN